jgi:hypothetical protein
MMDWDAFHAISRVARAALVAGDAKLWFCTWSHVADYAAIQARGME